MTKPHAPRDDDRHTHHLADEDVSTRGGALPAEGVPRETPDTQESLDSPDGAYRVDENEGEGDRRATAEEIEVEADGLEVTRDP